MQLVVSVVQRRLMMHLTNKAGKKHAENLRLQELRGKNFAFYDSPSNAQTMSDVSHAHSTFLGLPEIQELCLVLDAEAVLDFQGEQVCFSLGL